MSIIEEATENAISHRIDDLVNRINKYKIDSNCLYREPKLIKYLENESEEWIKGFISGLQYVKNLMGY